MSKLQYGPNVKPEDYIKPKKKGNPSGLKYAFDYKEEQKEREEQEKIRSSLKTGDSLDLSSGTKSYNAVVSGNKVIGFRNVTAEEQKQRTRRNDLEKRRKANADAGFYNIREDDPRNIPAAARAEAAVNQFKASTVNFSVRESQPPQQQKQSIVSTLFTPVNTTRIPVVNEFERRSDRLVNTVLAIEKYSGEQQSKSGNFLVSSFGKARSNSAITMSDAYLSAKEELKKPGTYLVAGAFSTIFKGGSKIISMTPGVKNLATPFTKSLFNTALLSSYVTYEGLNILSGNKSLGKSLGEGLAFGVAYQATTPIVDSAAKGLKFSARVTVKGAEKVSEMQIWSDKKGAVFRGGKRISPLSKATLRQQSFNAQKNNNVFYDKGEVGFRVRNKDLKQDQFVKERVIRFGRGKEGNIEITQVKDRLIGVTRSVTTNYRNDLNFLGKGSQPGFRKLYPQGFSSQSLSGGGKQKVVGFLSVEQTRAINLVPQPKGKVLEPQLPNIRPSKVGNTGLVTTGIQQQNPLYSSTRPPKYDTSGGFRPGMKDKIFNRLNEKNLFNQRLSFTKEVIGANLPKYNDFVGPTNVIKPGTITSTSSFYSSNTKTKLVPLSLFNPRENVSPSQNTSPLVKVSYKPGVGVASMPKLAQDSTIVGAYMTPQVTYPYQKGKPTGRGRPIINNFTDNTINYRPPTINNPSFRPVSPIVPRATILKKTSRQLIPRFNLQQGSFKKGKRTISFIVSQPKAFTPSGRASLFGITGKTPLGSIYTGLGERFVPTTTKRKTKKRKSKR